VLLGAVGAKVEAEKVSTIGMRVVQWGQRKPVLGTAGDSAAGNGTGLG
jgi:hypothetical protein